MAINHTKYETEMLVRPDDIDMNRHVHNSRYFDYVLAARYDQMGRCYGMSMEEYMAHGFSWVVRSAAIEYKRPLGLGDAFIVRTWIDEMRPNGVRIGFEILRKQGMKLASSGHFDYVLIDAASGRSVPIPDWVVERYSI